MTISKERKIKVIDLTEACEDSIMTLDGLFKEALSMANDEYEEEVLWLELFNLLEKHPDFIEQIDESFKRKVIEYQEFGFEYLTGLERKSYGYQLCFCFTTQFTIHDNSGSFKSLINLALGSLKNSLELALNIDSLNFFYSLEDLSSKEIEVEWVGIVEIQESDPSVVQNYFKKEIQDFSKLIPVLENFSIKYPVLCFEEVSEITLYSFE